MEHGHDSPLQVGVRWDGAVATVTIVGDLGITTAAALTRRLLAVAAGRPARLVLDLRGVALTDVAGAGELDDVHTLLQTVCPVILRRPTDRETQQVTCPRPDRTAATTAT